MPQATRKGAPRAARVWVAVEGGPHAGVSRASVERSVRAMLEALRMGDCEVSILLTGDARIAILNRIYRKKDRPTDVLAFAQREGEHGEHAGNLLGDVVVSVETARRQARARGVQVVSEVTMLLAHGLLHLLGWDHETPAKDKQMRRETERLCAAAHVTKPHARARSVADAGSGTAPGPSRALASKRAGRAGRDGTAAAKRGTRKLPRPRRGSA